jgi:hypothetical protein
MVGYDVIECYDSSFFDDKPQYTTDDALKDLSPRGLP